MGRIVCGFGPSDSQRAPGAMRQGQAMKSAGLVQRERAGILREIGPHDGIGAGKSRNANEGQLTSGEGERLLRIVSQAARIKTHLELFTLLQGEIQYFVPHQILIGAWGDFLGPVLNLDVISAIEGVRTSGLDACNIEGQCKRLYLRWLGQGRRPLLLEGGACELQLRTHPACCCALHVSLRRMRSILVHGVHDARDGSDSLYVAAHADSVGEPSRAERSCVPLDSVIAQIDVAFRRVAGLKLPRTAARRKAGGLSIREAEILGWVSEGRTNHEISTILGISTFTVKNHVQRIIRKLGAVNRTEAAAKYRHLADGYHRSVESTAHEVAVMREFGVTAK
jgi:transcriptional regulator EpsA